MYTYTEKPWRLHGFSVYVYIYLSMAIDRHVQPIVVPFCQSQIFIFDFDLYVSFAVFLWFANLKETLDRLRLADLTWEKINVSLWIRSLGLFFSVSLIRKLERDPWQIAFVGSALKKCQCQSLISFSRSLFQCFIIDLHTWKRPWQIAFGRSDLKKCQCKSLADHIQVYILVEYVYIQVYIYIYIYTGSHIYIPWHQKPVTVMVWVTPCKWGMSNMRDWTTRTWVGKPLPRRPDNCHGRL